MTSLTLKACEPTGRQAPRRRADPRTSSPSGSSAGCTPGRPSPRWSGSSKRFGKNQHGRRRQPAAFKAGYNFGETAELFDHTYEIEPARSGAGHLHQRQRATRRWRGAWSPPGSSPSCPCSSAATRSRRRPTSSTSCPSTRTSASAPSRPRTRSPASAPPSAPPSAVSSAFTTTSGPGIDLKSETIGLAISLELPLLIIDIQRGGPSTGLPTKTEQADLLHAMFGRHGESPVPIVAAKTPADCFYTVDRGGPHRPQVPHAGILLSDGYLANGAEPWQLPDVEDLPDLSVPFADGPNHTAAGRHRGVLALPAGPRDPGPAVGHPGHARPEHRIGGLEKADGTGQRLLRPGQPRAHGEAAGGQGRGHRQRHPADEVDDPDRRRRHARASAGDPRTAPSSRPRACCAPRAAAVAHGPCRAPQPVPVEPRRGRAPLPARCSSPR